MTICEIQNVSKSFLDFSDGTAKKRYALKDINLTINEGDFIVIGGSNGSGKTVLMTLIAGLEKCGKGKIIRSEKAGLIFQDADSQILGETPFEDVSFGAKNIGLKKEDLKNAVTQALKAVGLEEKMDRPARLMSGGEKRRLAVAGILVMKRNFIIFDEPFANLDWEGVVSVCKILKQLKDEGKTVIVLTHELEKVLALANRFVVLDKGEIRFDGKPEDGIKENLEQWAIRNPISKYEKIEDLVWM